MLLMPSLHIVQSEFIYESAPYPSCHAATIVQTKSGKLMAAWFGGTRESHPDVCIYGADWVHGKWTKPRLLASGVGPDGKPIQCYNPVLFHPSRGPLLLFYKAGPGPGEWLGYIRRSSDDGRTWSVAEQLPSGIFGPIKNKPIELRDGTIVCPSSTEDEGWRVHFEFTSDFGATWTRTLALNDGVAIGAIQPSLLTAPDGSLRAVGRTQQGQLFHMSGASDAKSWEIISLLDVLNPNSGTDAVTLRNGWHLLVYNPSKTERTPLSVALSPDGVTWTRALDLETEPGEYSYPAVIEAKDGTLHIVYTWRRQKIRHVVLKVGK